jgi:hypothetical protein
LAARTAAIPIDAKEDSMPIPTDPRSPQQRVRDQLAATRKKLAGQTLSRPQRARLADRIYDLTREAERLGA